MIKVSCTPPAFKYVLLSYKWFHLVGCKQILTLADTGGLTGFNFNCFGQGFGVSHYWTGTAHAVVCEVVVELAFSSVCVGEKIPWGDSDGVVLISKSRKKENSIE